LGHRKHLPLRGEISMSFESERIELDSMVDIQAAATPELVDELGLVSRTVGSAFVSIAAKAPATAIVINRALGLGLWQPETRESIDAMVAAYRAAGVERYFIQCHPSAEPAELAAWLTAAGLEKARGWQKFARGREALPKIETELRIEEIGPEHGAAFGRILCDAFDFGEGAVPWFAQLPGRRDWHISMSFVDGEPAGVGALYVKGDLADIDFGATDPKFRGRGIQSAVLARRVECALDLGCREIVTCTGVAVAGDPQHSYRNIKRVGFRETYIRDNYAPPRP
jgi:GNAT superfamily N-acetyltransferase